ncbi:MAG TPA: GNAT family N-acetyltransferase [Solirubrobacteraceae bacterium]|nr:GNAT family N-acetyltransferase [Solirubrobacteraceae bacterium]
MVTIAVRNPREDERAWVRQFLEGAWGTPVVSRGVAHDAPELPALLAVDGAEIVGLATFHFADGDCELVTLDALRGGQGIGSALLAAVGEEARRHGCRRLWLITSNDNVNAIRFYQRRGMRLVAVHRDAIDESRRIKPSIPVIGEHGIPIHDELQFEASLAD